MQMRFQLAEPLKEVLPVVEEEAEEQGVERLQHQALEQCHLDLVEASQHTFGLAAEAVGPLIRHRHHLEVEADLEARLGAWVLGVAGQTVLADLRLGIVSVQLALQHPNFASHP